MASKGYRDFSPIQESFMVACDGWCHVVLFIRGHVITLAQLAKEDREVEADVNEAFSTLVKFIPDGGYCCFTDALLTCWQWLPSLTPEEKQRFQDQLMEMEESN
jgi:hypothetical protein